MVFNATFNNISVISWLSVLMSEEIEVPGEKPPTCRNTSFSIWISMTFHEFYPPTLYIKKRVGYGHMSMSTQPF